MECRFKTHKTHKTYEAQFDKRNQLPGEIIEEYAATLKRLYDKAYVKWNPKCRREGLLRRFLHGLADDQARFDVEYHKDPAIIVEAVSHVMNYIEVRKAPNVGEMGDGDRSRKKNVTYDDHGGSDSEDNDSDFNIELRLRFKKRKRPVRKVAKTGKNDGKIAKTEYSGDESTENIPPSLKTQIEKKNKQTKTTTTNKQKTSSRKGSSNTTQSMKSSGKDSNPMLPLS